MSVVSGLVSIFVIVVVWGGFAFFLFKAISYEKKKMNNGKE